MKRAEDVLETVLVWSLVAGEKAAPPPRTERTETTERTVVENFILVRLGCGN